MYDFKSRFQKHSCARGLGLIQSDMDNCVWTVWKGCCDMVWRMNLFWIRRCRWDSSGVEMQWNCYYKKGPLFPYWQTVNTVDNTYSLLHLAHSSLCQWQLQAFYWCQLPCFTTLASTWAHSDWPSSSYPRYLSIFFECFYIVLHFVDSFISNATSSSLDFVLWVCKQHTFIIGFFLSYPVTAVKSFLNTNLQAWIINLITILILFQLVSGSWNKMSDIV